MLFVSWLIRFAGLSIQAFQQMPLVDVCISHHNDGHIYIFKNLYKNKPVASIAFGDGRFV